MAGGMSIHVRDIVNWLTVVIRVSLLPAMIGLGAFSIGTAVSQNPTSIFVTRLFAGIFGAAPVSNVAAVCFPNPHDSLIHIY
jgi:hypothetical protein